MGPPKRLPNPYKLNFPRYHKSKPPLLPGFLKELDQLNSADKAHLYTESNIHAAYRDALEGCRNAQQLLEDARTNKSRSVLRSFIEKATAGAQSSRSNRRITCNLPTVHTFESLDYTAFVRLLQNHNPGRQLSRAEIEAAMEDFFELQRRRQSNSHPKSLRKSQSKWEGQEKRYWKIIENQIRSSGSR